MKTLHHNRKLGTMERKNENLVIQKSKVKHIQ